MPTYLSKSRHNIDPYSLLSWFEDENPMLMGTIIDKGIVQSAGFAYIHYVSFMICFAALVLERKLLKVDPSRKEALAMIITDIIYGLAGLLLLISGILRVLYFGQGSIFYTTNPLFWWKVGVFLFVGVLSLYPTTTYILWALPLSKGNLPNVSRNLVSRLSWILNIEILGFAAIPILATLMSRGVGIY